MKLATVSTLLLALGALGCTKKSPAGDAPAENSPEGGGGGGTTDGVQETGGDDGIPIEKPNDPVIITGIPLTDGAPRCAAKPVDGTTDQYNVHCLAVQFVKGFEIPAGRVGDGFELVWQAPTAAGVQIVACDDEPRDLTQDCQVKVPATTATVDVTFSFKLTETKPDKSKVEKTATDVVTLPFSVRAYGAVPEVARLTKASGENGGDNWVFGSSDQFTLDRLQLASDARVFACGPRLYAVSRDRVLMLKDSGREAAADNTYVHVAGGVLPRNAGDLSDPRRTFWEAVESAACVGDDLLLATKRGADGGTTTLREPHVLAKDGTLAVPSSSYNFTSSADSVNAAVADQDGTVYFADGTTIRKTTAAGASQVVLDGANTNTSIYDISTPYPVLAAVYGLALDTDANGVATGLFIATADPVTYALRVIHVDLGTGAPTLYAGNGAAPDTTPRDGVAAASIALRNVKQLLTGKNAAGETVLVIVETFVGADPSAPNGELLAVDKNGMTKVLFTPGSFKLVNETGLTEINEGNNVASFDGTSYLLATRFHGEADVSYNVVKVPLAGGPPTWVAGAVAPQVDPVGDAPVDPRDLSLQQPMTAFSPANASAPGVLYTADNNRKVLYKADAQGRFVPVLAPPAGGVQHAFRFGGTVVAFTVYRDTVATKDMGLYIEQEPVYGMREIKLLDLAAGTATEVTGSAQLFGGVDCDVAGDPLSRVCTPEDVTVDPQGRIVFFDIGYRLIRRFENGTLTTLAGQNTDLTVFGTARAAGQTQTAGNLGLSHVSGLTFDAAGSLFFADRGGQESDGGPVYTFKPFIAKLAASTAGNEASAVVTTIAGGGTTTAESLTANAEIEASALKMGDPQQLTVLSDGTVLFGEGQLGIVLSLRPSTGGAYKAARFLGAANADCGISADGAGGAPTLAGALARHCTGKVEALRSYGLCTGADHATGTLQIAISQRFTTLVNKAGSSVLYLSAACAAVKDGFH